MNPKIKSICLGILSISPWILFIAFAPFVLNNMTTKTADGFIKNDNFITKYLIIGNLYVFIMIVLFEIYLFKSICIERGKKWLWFFVILLGHVFTLPVFWFIYIRNKTKLNIETKNNKF
jgi:hypothetical protein